MIDAAMIDVAMIDVTWLRVSEDLQCPDNAVIESLKSATDVQAQRTPAMIDQAMIDLALQR